jgi:hypothetical protein
MSITTHIEIKSDWKSLYFASIDIHRIMTGRFVTLLVKSANKIDYLDVHVYSESIDNGKIVYTFISSLLRSGEAAICCHNLLT